MRVPTWPDSLQKPESTQIQQWLIDFWNTLAKLPNLIKNNEHLLAEEVTSDLRKIILNLMLSLNGIQRPVGTIHLNSYLGESQRQVLEKTLVTSTISGETWLGRAVALIVIYRWYAPQLVEKFGLEYSQSIENATLQQLQTQLPDWPMSIETE